MVADPHPGDAGADRAATGRADLDRAGTDRAGADRAGASPAATNLATTDRAATGLAGVLRALRVGRGQLAGLVVTPGVVAVAAAGADPVVVRGDVGALVATADDEVRPRWVLWSPDTAHRVLAAGGHLATAWDLAAVHRILAGGWRASPGEVWAAAHGLTTPPPRPAPPDLLSLLDDAAGHDGATTSGDEAPGDEPGDGPVGVDGHLRPHWTAGGWADAPGRAARWAALALDTALAQQRQLAAIADRPAAPATARIESTAELLCAELSAGGLPLDREEAERIVAGFVGPRPRDEADAARARAERDARVLRHAPTGTAFTLRNPGQVRSLLRAVGIEVPDERAHRLEALADAHPLVPALLRWRREERIATTYGYAWLDRHVTGGRLRGEWTASDGAAGRMTATAGLHNMPAELRPAVVADPGWVFVRADLGQIEPRVLAAVSGDAALARATHQADMYAPVAAALGVDRATAKVAMLGAMYGQTTGHGAAALRRLDRAYPVAMAFLRDAAAAGEVGRDIRTVGGRLVRLGHRPAAPDGATGHLDDDARPGAGGAAPQGAAASGGGDGGWDGSPAASADRRRAAAYGRYARNAAVQGAAAEMFKLWAVTVRARAVATPARLVLCLHDELLVHTPEELADDTTELVESALAEAAGRWAPGGDVRFVADVAVVRRWSDAKA